jgi:hypothetical protein
LPSTCSPSTCISLFSRTAVLATLK